MHFKLDPKTGTFVPTTSEENVAGMKENALQENDNSVNMIKQDPNEGEKIDLSDEPIESFKRVSDLSVFQINDKQTGKVMGIIAGYALQIKFNKDVITSVEDVEQCAEGIKKLFYNIIMDQLLESNK